MKMDLKSEAEEISRLNNTDIPNGDKTTEIETSDIYQDEIIPIISNTINSNDNQKTFIHSNISYFLWLIFSLFGYTNVYESIFYLLAKNVHITINKEISLDFNLPTQYGNKENKDYSNKIYFDNIKMNKNAFYNSLLDQKMDLI